MKQRIITAMIAAAVFIPFVVYGQLPFTIVIYMMAAIGMFEILRMKGISVFSVPGILGELAIFILLLPNEWAQKILKMTSYSKLEMMYIVVILLLVYSVIVKNKFTFDDVAFVLLGAVYVGLGFYYFIETRNAGLQYVIFALLIVWTTDSGAYFTGRKFGKNKLWPEISPNKTVEGFVGGIVIAVAFAIGMQLITPITPNFALLLIVTVIASVFGQMGDLVESAIKRHYNIKDSGKLLPGHGGILDRFDSLLFVLPLLHFFQIVV